MLCVRIAAVKNLRVLLQPLGIGSQSTGGATSSSSSGSATTNGGSLVSAASLWSTFTFTLRIECGDQRVFASCREVSVLAALSSDSVLSWEEEFQLPVAPDRAVPLVVVAELSDPSISNSLELAQQWVPIDSLREGSTDARRHCARLEEHFKQGVFDGNETALGVSSPSTEVELLLRLSPVTINSDFDICEIPPPTLDDQVSSDAAPRSEPPTVANTTPSVLPRSAGGEVTVTGTGFGRGGRAIVRLFALTKNHFTSSVEEQQILAVLNSTRCLQRTNSSSDGFKSYFRRDVDGTVVSSTTIKFMLPQYLRSYNVYYSVSCDGHLFTEVTRASSVLLFSVSSIAPTGGPISGNTYTTLHGTNIDACVSSRTGLTPLVQVTWRQGTRELEHVTVPGECYPQEDAVYFYSPQSKFGLHSVAVNVELAMVSGVAEVIPQFGQDEVSFVMYKTPTIKSIAPLSGLVSGLSTTEVIVQGIYGKSVEDMKLTPKFRFKRREQMQVSDAQLVSETRFECIVPRFSVANAVALELPASILLGLPPLSKPRVGGNPTQWINAKRPNVGPAKLWTRTSGIFVALLGARDLRASKKNACNPFGVIYVGKKHMRSTRKDGAYSPVWNELFDFEWSATDEGTTLPSVRVTLESQLTADQSESLGHVELTFPTKEKLTEPFCFRAWIPLRRIRGKYVRKETEESVTDPQQRSKSKKTTLVAVAVPSMGELELAIAFVPPAIQAKKPKNALRTSIISAISTHPQTGKQPQNRDGVRIFKSKKERLLRAFRQRGAPTSLIPTELSIELALNGQDFWSMAPSTCFATLTPIVTDVEPKFVCIAGGTQLYVSGVNFFNSGCIRVAFAVLVDTHVVDSERVVIIEARYRSSTSIVCTTPPLSDLATEASYVNVYVSLNGSDFDSIALPKQAVKLSESPTETSPHILRVGGCVEEGDETVEESSIQTSQRKSGGDTIVLVSEQYVVDYHKLLAAALTEPAVNKAGGVSPRPLSSFAKAGNFLLVPQLRVYLTPKIARVRPTDGVYTSHLTIDGTNFTNTNAGVVRFTSMAVVPETRTARLMVVSSTQMECSVPDFPRGAVVRIAVAINGVEFVQCPGELRVFQTPRLVELFPNWISATTTIELELRGINLVAASLKPSDNNRGYNDGGIVQVSFTVDRGKKVVRGVCEDGQVYCSIPREILQLAQAGSRAAPSSHTLEASSPILVDVWIGGTCNAFTGSPLPLYVYREIPTVNSVSPMDGPIFGGFAIVIEGSNFADTSKIVVRFQLYKDQTPRVEDERPTSKPLPCVDQRRAKGGKGENGDDNNDAEVRAAAESMSYVDVVAKFVSSERVLCPAPSFPQEGVFTVLVALNGVEFSQVSDGSWFLAWQNWQKRKHLLSRALLSRANAPEETGEENVERLLRKTSFTLPKIKSALSSRPTETPATTSKGRGLESLPETDDANDEAMSADPRLLRWRPTSTSEEKLCSRSLLSLLEYLCDSQETQRLTCRRLRVAFRLQYAKSSEGQEPTKSGSLPALRFPAFVNALRMIFPNAVIRDLEFVWHAADHRADGTMSIKQLLKRLLRDANGRSSSPEPGPTHYEPRYSMVTSRETSAVIMPPTVQPEHISDPPSALFIDYEAAVQAIKPRPPRQVFRKRKFNTSWCNPVVDGALKASPSPPHSPTGVPSSGMSEASTTTIGSDITATDGSDRSRKEHEKTEDIGSQPTGTSGAAPIQAQTKKEDKVRVPVPPNSDLKNPSRRATRGVGTSTAASSSQMSAISPSAVLSRRSDLGGLNPFYNDIAPLYAKFLNSAEVQRFLKQ